MNTNNTTSTTTTIGVYQNAQPAVSTLNMISAYKAARDYKAPRMWRNAMESGRQGCSTLILLDIILPRNMTVFYRQLRGIIYNAPGTVYRREFRAILNRHCMPSEAYCRDAEHYLRVIIGFHLHPQTRVEESRTGLTIFITRRGDAPECGYNAQGDDAQGAYDMMRDVIDIMHMARADAMLRVMTSGGLSPVVMEWVDLEGTTYVSGVDGQAPRGYCVGSLRDVSGWILALAIFVDRYDKDVIKALVAAIH